MQRKKILVVSNAFYPEISPRSFRTTELVKEMCRQGHDVTLYTEKKEQYHEPIEKEFGVLIKDLGHRKFTLLDLTRGSKPVILFKRVFNRALLQLVEFPDIEWMFKVKKALKNEAGYDMLISIAAPHPVHWGVAWARTAMHPIATTWVADSGDPFMGTIMDSFRKFFYFKYFEQWFCRKADHITVPIIVMKENYYPEFRSKIVEIPQGFKFDEVPARDEKVSNLVPTFAFAGTFIRTLRNPTPLLQYLSTVDAPFKFIIYTKTTEQLIPFKEVLKDKLEIRDYVPRLELLKILGSMDFLVNIGYDPVHQSPSKLIDYYLTGKPILSSTTNEFDKKTVDEFLQGNYSGRFQFNNIDQYRIENVCKSFINLVPRQ